MFVSNAPWVAVVLNLRAAHGVGKEHSTVGPGRIQQAFVLSLKEDMTEYYRLIAVLGAQLNLDEERAGRIFQVGEILGRGGTEGLTLRRLAVWVLDPLERLKIVATLVAVAAHMKVSSTNTQRNHMIHSNLASKSSVLLVVFVFRFWLLPHVHTVLILAGQYSIFIFSHSDEIFSASPPCIDSTFALRTSTGTIFHCICVYLAM